MLGTSVTYDALNIETHQLEPTTVAVKSLLTGDGIRFILTSMIRNFMGFGPVGIILVAMVGVGIAEEGGLMRALIHKTVAVAPSRAITFIIVFVGLMSSIATDAGYSSDPAGRRRLLYARAPPARGPPRWPTRGWPPASPRTSWIAPLDGILTEITNDAIHLLDPTLTLDITANFYFSVVSTFVMALVVTVIKVLEPRLGLYHGADAWSARKSPC